MVAFQFILRAARQIPVSAAFSQRFVLAGVGLATAGTGAYRSFHSECQQAVKVNPNSPHNPKVEVLSSPAITMLLSVVRDKNTGQKDFVAAADRLMNILVEEGLARMSQPCTVESLRRAHGDVKTGKILIQRDEETAEPKLFYSKLPANMPNLDVVLCDPMLATGGSAIMAINVLKEAGVKEENIFFLNVISCPEGLQKMAKETPGVKILTTACDTCLNGKKYIVPGVGDFGDRYYGTL